MDSCGPHQSLASVACKALEHIWKKGMTKDLEVGNGIKYHMNFPNEPAVFNFSPGIFSDTRTDLLGKLNAGDPIYLNFSKA